MWMLLRAPKMYFAHLRVPAVGLMAEMHASFQKLTHGEVGKRHDLLRLIRRGPCEPVKGATGWPLGPLSGHKAKVRV